MIRTLLIKTILTTIWIAAFLGIWLFTDFGCAFIFGVATNMMATIDNMFENHKNEDL